LYLQITDPPNSNIDNFFTSLNDYQEHFENSNKRYVIAGDMSTNILDANISDDFVNIMASQNFISCINNYTRILNTTKSCIDQYMNDGMNCLFLQKMDE